MAKPTAKASISPSSSEPDIKRHLADRKTHWGSVWVSIALQGVVGVQVSIYFMSMWPYLERLDDSASLDFLGYVIAGCSLGSSIATPLFGLWNQMTMSTRWPVTLGLLLAACGQAIYALLPWMSERFDPGWTMLIARIVTGCGVGSLGVLRSYGAMASVAEDRMKAVSFGTAGYVLGMSVGPTVQAAFTPVGTSGFKVGDLTIDMYNAPAFAMVVLCLSSIFIVHFCFKEHYPGIISDEDKEKNPFLVVPKYNLQAALLLIYCWLVSCSLATNIEVISTPFTTALYGWSNEKAVLWNGVIETITCVISVGLNFVLGYTRLGEVDLRKQILFGLTAFFLYYVVNFPWPFFPGPIGHNNGCTSTMDWCEHTTRVPFGAYLFAFIGLFGAAFPFVSSPCSTLFSQVLGPRKQGVMQGLMFFAGSFAQFLTPIVVTYVFKRTGYIWIAVLNASMLLFGIVWLIFAWKRLVPLSLEPPPAGRTVRYKAGVYARF